MNKESLPSLAISGIALTKIQIVEANRRTIVTAEQDLVSVNALACELRWPAASLRATAQSLDIAPVLKLNSISYFSREQAEQLAAHLHANGGAKPKRERERMVATPGAGSERLVASSKAEALVAE